MAERTVVRAVPSAAAHRAIRSSRCSPTLIALAMTVSASSWWRPV